MSSRMFSGILVSLLLISMLILAFNIQPVKAEPKTWTVDDDGPADFHTIGEAVVAAGFGDTIYVRNGTYNEHVVISYKPTLRVVGEDRSNTIIDGNGYGPIVNIVAGLNVTFANFTLQNAGWTSSETDWKRDNGVVLEAARSSQITDCIISGCAFGIQDAWEDRGHSNVFSGNTVSDCTEIAIGSSSDSSMGDIVANNTITNSTNGIYFNNPYNTQILDNHIFKTESQYSDYGIHLQVGGSNNTIVGNRIEYSGNAIRLDYADSNLVEENIVENCTYGVFVGYESSDNIVAENNASDSDIGIMIWDNSNNNTVTNNLASNNYYGIGISSSNQNKIYHNNLINNTYQVLNIGDSANVWDNGYPSGGNYWSDYNGMDANHDGIGDTPYVIDASNLDNYPWISSWMHIVGDVNGDGKVDLGDFSLLALAYNSELGNANWNEHADLAPPWGIISLTDLVTMAAHYGQHNP